VSKHLCFYKLGYCDYVTSEPHHQQLMYLTTCLTSSARELTRSRAVLLLENLHFSADFRFEYQSRTYCTHHTTSRDGVILYDGGSTNRKIQYSNQCAELTFKVTQDHRILFESKAHIMTNGTPSNFVVRVATQS